MLVLSTSLDGDTRLRFAVLVAVGRSLAISTSLVVRFRQRAGLLTTTLSNSVAVAVAGDDVVVDVDVAAAASVLTRCSSECLARDRWF